MNTKLYYPLIALIILFAFISLRANNNESAKAKQVEQNLLVGVQSENDGLRISSAYYLGEMKSTDAVFHLTKMLREDKNTGARLMAALSLVKIEDEQGLYMVKRTALFNSSERVRRMSDKLYYAFLIKEYIKNNPEQAPMFAGLIN